MENKSDIKILLVDDREDNLFSIEAILEKDGYQFARALSGKQALKILLKEQDFTLILMDVQMPVLNGIETASLIYEREKLKHIPIIFITANNFTQEYIFKGYKTGGVDYILKPIDSDLLRAKVSVFVDLYRKNHLLRAHELRLREINSELEERVKQRTEELLNKNIELEITNSELKRVNNDLNNFVYVASHDLKAPVSNIEGLLFTLIDSMGELAVNDENIKIILDMMGESVLRFKSTINDLAEITKVQKDLDFDIDDVNLIEVIENVKTNIRDLIINSDANINIDVDNCPNIKFSKKNLNIIFFNLISNAIKYKSPERKAKIKIKSEIQGEFVLLSISDNGLGFDPKNKDKIFTMFKRLHDHVEGSGVGLYLVKRIMENCGGKIEVDSVPDKGSVFKVYFKLNHSPELAC